MHYGRLLNSRHTWVAPAQGTAGDLQQLPGQRDENLVFLPTSCNAKHPLRSDYTQIQYQQLTSDLVEGKALQLTSHSNYKRSMEGKASLCLIERRWLKPMAPTSPWIYCALRSDLKHSVSIRWPHNFPG